VVYEHDISACLAEAIGEHGLSAARYADALARTGPALERLRAWHAEGALPLLALPGRGDDLAVLEPFIDKASRKFSDLVVLATGGSSLGGQALAALKVHPLAPADRNWLHFADNIDPHDFGVLIDGLDLANSLFVVISKSGGTAETLTQFLIALDAVRTASGDESIRGSFLVVTEPGDTPLRRLAQRWRLPFMDHDAGLGGRYSVLSLVGLLPAMFAGVDARAVRAGAAQVLETTLGAEAPEQAEPARGAAVSVGLAEERGIAATVMMPYCDRLGPFAMWFRQLWAESLGKDGTGTTPIRAIGALDQHSQLQLYLDGPRDKMFTLVTLDVEGTGRRVEPALVADDPALAYLSGRTIGDLCAAEQRATAETLARSGRPVRVIRIDELDERTLGALLMHFMLETIIAAELLGVDPFDQPAVEQGKVLARQYLAGEEEAVS
jgi:glucose-6-phosphate isomerase